MYSVIIVDFDSIKITMKYIAQCLERIQERKKLHFVVVDNMPRSRSCYILEKDIKLELQKKKYKGMNVLCLDYCGAEVRVIQTQRNLGYARGNNVGIEFSGDEWADPYIVLSNNDIEFPDKISLDILRTVLEQNDRTAVVGPHIEGINGKCQGPYEMKMAWNELIVGPIRMLRWMVFGPKTTKKEKASAFYPSGEYYWVSGCFLVCVREKMRQVNNFDENTFLYGEEMILSERLKRAGFTMYYCNDVKIVHRGSETVARHFRDLEAEEILFESLFYYYKRYRNTNIFILLLSRVNFAMVKVLFWFGKRVNHIFKLKQ